MTNPVWNSFGNINEQKMYDSMIREVISIKGFDAYYLPRTRLAFDNVYYEDSQSVFSSAYALDLYCDLDKDFQGKGTFVSQLGMMEVRDQITFWVSATEFSEKVSLFSPTSVRPMESDLIYFPLNKRLFEIQETRNKPFFYQLGELQLFTMTCELIEYSNERLETGLDEIDSIQSRNSTNQLDYALTNEDGTPLFDSNGNVVINDQYQTTSDKIDPARDNKDSRDEATSEGLIDFTEAQPYANNQVY